MNPAAFAVRNWQFTLVLTLFAALGFNAFMAIPRAEDPKLHAPLHRHHPGPGMAVEVR